MSSRSPLFLTLASDISGTPSTNPTTGDEFTVKLQPPITIDDPRKWRVMPIRTTSWHTSPNISASRLNNQFRYTAAAPAPNPGVFTLTLPDALYSVGDLEAEIASQMVANGHGTILNPVFKFDPLIAAGKVQITMTALTYTMDFTIANTIRNVIGFAAAVFGPPAAVPFTYVGASVADFPQGVNSHVVHISAIRDGYLGGISGDAFVDLSLSNTTPNRQVTQVNTTRYSMAPAGTHFSQISVYLTNQAGQRISLNGNTYSVSLAFVPLKETEG